MVLLSGRLVPARSKRVRTFHALKVTDVTFSAWLKVAESMAESGFQRMAESSDAGFQRMAESQHHWLSLMILLSLSSSYR